MIENTPQSQEAGGILGQARAQRQALVALHGSLRGERGAVRRAAPIPTSAVVTALHVLADSWTGHRLGSVTDSR